MEIKAAIHFHRVGYAGADKVIAISATAAEVQGSIGAVNDADKGGISTQAEKRVAGQTEVSEIQSIAGGVNDASATQAGAGGCSEYF